MSLEIDYLETRYSFTSSTYEVESNRYITEYNVDIYAHLFDDSVENLKPVLIGKASLMLLLLGLADDNKYSYREIFDHSMTLSDLSGLIFDWETGSLKEKFEDWASDSWNSNILYIDKIEILPAYRNRGFGKKILKDILSRFSGCFGVMILQAFPLQFKSEYALGIDQQWDILMEYDKMEQDEKLATKKLYSFYKSLGFKKLFKDNYFFYNSGLRNSKLDKIDIDE
jgi:hypothetical protein